MVPKQISTAQLTGILMAVKGHKFITITTETEPKMRKTNNPFHGHIIKRSTANVSMNFEYANVVNNRREKEGNEEKFVPKPRKWGERIDGTCFVMHNGAMYMEVHYKSAPSATEYIDTRDNSNVSKDLLAPYLQEPNTSAVAEGQGLENAVILRDIKIGNIRECKMNGEHYIVR